MVYIYINENLSLDYSTFDLSFLISSRFFSIFFLLLADFTFIHSKFLAALPPNVDEFISSLHLAFPQVLDVNHLVKDIGLVRKTTNISATMSYLKNRFFAPIAMEIPHQGWSFTIQNHIITLNHMLAFHGFFVGLRSTCDK